MNLLQIPSTIETYSRRMDGTLKLVISCQELAPEDMATLAGLAGKFGYTIFKENTIQLSEIPKENAKQEGGKKPSVRLRNVLFIHWSECTNKSLDFDTYYAQQVEKYIILIKEKLPAKDDLG